MPGKTRSGTGNKHDARQVAGQASKVEQNNQDWMGQRMAGGKIHQADGAKAAWPTKLTVDAARRTLSVAFDDGSSFDISAELMRVNSPSAEVQGHSPDQRVTVWGKRNVAIRQLVPVGNYAVRVAFDDGHDTGIFTWAYLHELGREHETLLAAHEAELREKGLSR
jgi:DUF971 family protein